MVTLKKSKTRSERRAEVVKKITTNKENARAFLVRAGIVNKSGIKYINERNFIFQTF